MGGEDDKGKKGLDTWFKKALETWREGHLEMEIEKCVVGDEHRDLRKKEDLEERAPRIYSGRNFGTDGKNRGGGIVDLTEEEGEEDKITQLAIENNVLACEKKKAEIEVEVWKWKYKALELRVFELEKSLHLRAEEHNLEGRSDQQLAEVEMGAKVMQSTVEEEKIKGVSASDSHADGKKNLQTQDGIPADATPCKQFEFDRVQGVALSCTRLENASGARKQLLFVEGGTRNNKMASCTPASGKPTSVGFINVSDGESETDFQFRPKMETPSRKSLSVSNQGEIGIMLRKEETPQEILKKGLVTQNDEEDIDTYKRNSPFRTTPKRKRATNIVASDTDDEDDDSNVPISKRKTQHHKESTVESSADSDGEVIGTVTRRRLMKLRKCDIEEGLEGSSCSNMKKSKTERNDGISTMEDAVCNETEEDESESEGDSLGGFFVDNSEVSESPDASVESYDNSESADVSQDSGDESQGNVDYGEIMSRIRRKKERKSNWEFEADMLADFGKDPELCMQAVCALYRQQTADERDCKGTIHLNQRGFSQCDAHRGTYLAEFLTGGNPRGDLVRSAEELQARDSGGVELCRKLATRYSKQLFAIYSNKEDPFFSPLQ